MVTVSMRTTLDAPADEVWKTVGDFGSAHRYLVAVEEVSVEGEGVGSVRVLTFQNGDRFVEMLEGIDEEERTVQYATLDTPLPLVTCSSEIAVRDRNGRCEVEWTSTFEAADGDEAEMRSILEAILYMGFDGLKKLHGS